MSQETSHSTAGDNGKRSGGFRISRRAFLGVSALGAAALTAVLAIRRPKIFESGEADKETTSAVTTEQLVATSCLNCPTRCAIHVRVVNGKAVKISGNPNSIYSDGKTCPRSHVGLQVLYNPDRFSQPLVRKAGTTKGRSSDLSSDFEATSWENALEQVTQRLRGLPPDRLLVLQGLNTTSNEDLIRHLARAFGTRNVFLEESLQTDADREGKMMGDGRENSGYEMESLDGTAAKYILSFGAGIVESERPLARNLRKWGRLRRETTNRAKIVVLEPRYSVTAAKADQWVPINPGSEGALAMAMAGVIINEDLYDTDFIDNWTDGFGSYRAVATSPAFSPENVAGLAGVEAEVIREIAREFARAKPALAWSGESAISWPFGTYASHAIYCLNALVGAIDVPGGVVYQEYPNYRPMPAVPSAVDPRISFREAEGLLKGQSVDVLLGFDSDLIMSVPDPESWEAALESVPFYVHIGPAVTEMAAYADVILPAATYLEDWGYESALPGSGYPEARIKQPVITEPLPDSRPIARIIFEMTQLLGPPIAEAFTSIVAADPESFPEEFVKYRTGSFVSWEEFRDSGVWKNLEYGYRKYDEVFDTASGKFEFKSGHLERVLNLPVPGEDTVYPLMLSIYRPVLEIQSGSQNYPWAQEVYLVMLGRGWNNYVELSPEAAHEYGIGDGDRVIVESVVGELETQARIMEGIRPRVIAIASGQGHWNSGRHADGIGVNPNRVIRPEYDEESGQPSFFSTRVKIRKA